MSQESRRAVRRTVHETVQVTNTMTGDIVGRIGNLSVGGVLLIASTPLMDDALYQLRFVLPNERDASPIEAGAHVLWQDTGNSAGLAWVGMRFLGLPAESLNRLRRWSEADARLAS